jgi:hypothetical protein
MPHKTLMSLQVANFTGSWQNHSGSRYRFGSLLKHQFFKVNKSLFDPCLKQFINPDASKDCILFKENLKRELHPSFLIWLWSVSSTFQTTAPNAFPLLFLKCKILFQTHRVCSLRFHMNSMLQKLWRPIITFLALLLKVSLGRAAILLPWLSVLCSWLSYLTWTFIHTHNWKGKSYQFLLPPYSCK